MSDNETTAPVEAPLQPLELTRNEETLRLVPFKVLKGPKKNNQYLAPQVDFSSLETLMKFVKWLGIASVAGILQTWAKRTFQDIYFGAIDAASGLWNQEKFLLEAASCTEAGMKLKEIEEKYEEAQAQLGQRIQKAIAGGSVAFADPQWQKDTGELNEYILALKAMADKRSRRGKDAEAEPEPSVEVS